MARSVFGSNFKVGSTPGLALTVFGDMADWLFRDPFPKAAEQVDQIPIEKPVFIDTCAKPRDEYAWMGPDAQNRDGARLGAPSIQERDFYSAAVAVDVWKWEKRLWMWLQATPTSWMWMSVT